ncbi:MAG: hypothetical protein HKP38_04720 [Croceitalea sp.]|nr:hypothetical protein [Croceitalea sp.]MBT8237204.1 hypothetical protein [Croceitalea sp.]NNL08508.1 hypothetical protein [Croceitalea sp.]NNM18376.1 hypothetical protein [Croceitalea sp.]
MKKVLKITGIIILVTAIGIVAFLWAINEPLPNVAASPSKEADALAHKMLHSLNYEAYKKTRYLEWTYRNGANQYKWDKMMGQVDVRWSDIVVQLNLPDPTKSKAVVAGRAIKGEDKSKMVAKAIANFNNDSFWLVAPFKVFDKGTQRSIFTNKDGSQSLLVTYTSGGSTPGDSYLWLLNNDGFPNGFKMWVKIIPVGGIEASWDDWLVTESGAFLPKSHALGPLTLSMGDVRAYN